MTKPMKLSVENKLKGSFYSDQLYDFHKLCKKFPNMKSDRIMELSETIAKYGQQEDIILLDGLILDGRHLYWACKAAGVTPRFKNYDSNLDPWVFVKIKNFYRRHLTTAQRAALALEDLKIEEKKAKLRMKRTQFNGRTKENKPKLKSSASYPWTLAEDNTEKGTAVEKVAKEWKIAPKSLRKAKKLKDRAKEDKVVKEQWEKAKNNEITLEEAYRKANAIALETKIKKETLKNFVESGVRYIKSKEGIHEAPKPMYCKDCPNIEKVICSHCKEIILLCCVSKIPVVKRINDKTCYKFNKS